MTRQLTIESGKELSPFFSQERFQNLREELNNLLSRFSTEWDGAWLLGEHHPSLDLAEADDTFELKMDLPGIKPEDLDIQVTEDTVTITARREEESEESGKTWRRLERKSGTFSRVVPLPAAIKRDQVEANCKDGVLTLSLPKSAETKTYKVPVKG